MLGHIVLDRGFYDLESFLGYTGYIGYDFWCSQCCRIHNMQEFIVVTQTIEYREFVCYLSEVLVTKMRKRRGLVHGELKSEIRFCER